tara:strand:+ start:234 stop:1178 length:945 start_codon:yes stop_codon:yes gene_type:complete
MPNKHLRHPEDSVLHGRKVVWETLQELVNATRLSVKWDGAPAIVWGTNPKNGHFFVGTKSVFNKRQVKINYTVDDIVCNHKGPVADILKLCLEYLPRTDKIYQGDWIGVGMSGRLYQPNTVEYLFPEEIPQKIVVAPHTEYTEVSPEAEAKIGVTLESSEDCFFVNTNNATIKPPLGWRHLIPFIIPVWKMQAPIRKKGYNYYLMEISKHINSYVCTGWWQDMSAEQMYSELDDKYKSEVNVYTFKVWFMILDLKRRLLDAIKVDGEVECFINGDPSKHEGFVICSDNPYKIVDRWEFSKANFNLDKNWSYEEV